MSTRPARQICLPSKYTENGDDSVVLTSHRKATTFNLVRVSPISEPSPSIGPTDADVSSSPSPQTQTLAKRPHTSLGSHSDDVASTTDAADATPSTKRLKSIPTQAVALQNNILIISIDDVDNLQNERLNKTDPTADIKEFFIPLPLIPGQDKARVLCKPCR